MALKIHVTGDRRYEVRGVNIRVTGTDVDIVRLIDALHWAYSKDGAPEIKMLANAITATVGLVQNIE